MADNYLVRDGAGNPLTIKTKASTSLDANNNPIQIPQSIPSDLTGTPLGDSNPASVAVQPRQVTWIDRSAGNGTQVALTTSSVAIIPANTSRKGFWLQNLDRNNFMYLNFGAAAANGAGSIVLPPFELYVMPLHMLSTGAVYAMGDVAGQLYTAKENT